MCYPLFLFRFLLMLDVSLHRVTEPLAWISTLPRPQNHNWLTKYTPGKLLITGPGSMLCCVVFPYAVEGLLIGFLSCREVLVGFHQIAHVFL